MTFWKKGHRHDKHDKHDKFPSEDYERLREENIDLKDELKDAEENHQLAKVSLTNLNAKHTELESLITSEHESHAEAMLARENENAELAAHLAAYEESHGATAAEANDRSNQLVLELAEKGVTCDSLKETCENLRHELLSKQEASEGHENKMHEELQKVEEAASSTRAALHEELSRARVESKELEDLKEELARKSAEHSAAVAAGREESSEKASLQEELAKQERHLEHRETLIQDLQSQLEEAKENARLVRELRLEVLQEKKRYAAAELNQAKDPEFEKSLSHHESDSQMQPVEELNAVPGTEEHSDPFQALQSECTKLKSELRCANAEAKLRDANDAIVQEENQAEHDSHAEAMLASERKNSELLAQEKSVNDRSNQLEHELHEKDVSCNSFRENYESVRQELLNKQEASEVLESKLREELQEVENSASSTRAALHEELSEARAESKEKMEELKEELAHENAEHSVAVAAGREESSENASLHEEIAKHEAHVEHSETRIQDLHGQLEEAKALEEVGSKLREELQEVEEASSSTKAALCEELTCESAKHAAAVAAGREESSENASLQEKIAEQETHMEDSETLMQELRSQLENSKASPPQAQPVIEDGHRVRELQLELEQEKERYDDLQQTLDDEKITVETYMNMCDDDDAKSRIDHLRDLQNECAKLKKELKCANAEAAKLREQEQTGLGRIHRPTAEFGVLRSMRSVPGAEDESSPARRGPAMTFAKLTFDDLGEGNDSMLSDSAAFAEPSQDFNPPPRTKAPVVRFNEEDNAPNPFDTAVAPNPFGSESAANPFETSSPNPFGSETQLPSSNPFNTDTSNSFGTGSDSITNDAYSFGEKKAKSEGLIEGATHKVEHAWHSAEHALHLDRHISSQHGVPMSHTRSDDVVPREEYMLEVQACSHARQEALQSAKKAREGADSDVMRELQRAQRALVEEEAKSRRLCEHALRAEQSRKSLYHEIMEDYKATDKNADLVKLAQLVGRAAKAIAAVSAVAPRLAPAVFSPAADTYGDNPAPISRTPASPRPVHQETLSGLQGAPGRPPRSPRQRGGDEAPNHSIQERERGGPNRIPALPSQSTLYTSMQPGLCTPSFDKATQPMEDAIKAADELVDHHEVEGLGGGLM